MSPSGDGERSKLDPPSHWRHRRDAPARLVSDFPDLGELTGIVVLPSHSALVLGSTQPEESIDARACASRGLVVVRRRSGGGGVLVRPDAQLWVDVFVPSGHRHAHHDVARAALFPGRLWVEALQPLVRGELVVHDGPLIATPWSRVDCFSGVGPGEVLLDGTKLVGISQRRSRSGTWFFTMAHLRFDADEHGEITSLDRAARDALVLHLARGVSTLPVASSVAEEALAVALAAAR